jgi:septum formation protein
MNASASIYLASKSPRRQALLRQIGIAFDTLLLREAAGRPADVLEETRDGEPAQHYVERIARTKATVGWQRMQRRGLLPRPVLGADTEVVLEASRATPSTPRAC